MGDFDDLSLKDEINMIETNLIALHILTKLYVRQMKKGYILNISSAAGFQPVPYMSTYGATKAYVLQFTRAVGYEMKRQHKNIHIAALCPGPVNTEFNQVAGASFQLRSISAKKCANAAIKGLFSKNDLIIPGLQIKTLVGISKIIPTKIILPFEYWMQRSKSIRK